eukprot:1327421-Amphidinium_carterae.2
MPTEDPPPTAEAAEESNVLLGPQPDGPPVDFDAPPFESQMQATLATSNDTPGWDAPRGMHDPAPTRARARRSHDVRTAEAEARPAIPPSINKIHLKWLDGSRFELHCSQLRTGSYQWKVSSGVNRYAKTGQTTRGVVLRRWHDDYVNLLDPSSAADLLMTVRLLEGEQPLTPSMPAAEAVEDTRLEETVELVDAPLWRLPSLEDIENFPSFDALQEPMIVSKAFTEKPGAHCGDYSKLALDHGR